MNGIQYVHPILVFTFFVDSPPKNLNKIWNCKIYICLKKRYKFADIYLHK